MVGCCGLRAPVREKYIDELLGVWIEFGTHTDGTVDVANQNQDLFIGVPPEVAKALIEANEEFRQKVYKIVGYHD